ncbi:AAA family ATPase [Pararhodonellum marinum]|uniref:AAA family ATPase n=1 Tax=Pararhodonellum marinum TaxID=2755358 RepID=UPI00188F7B6C|nr:AAA family ATPase [Pararhodonellum marinum]
MLNYHDYEKSVYEAFLKKRNEDNRYNFSVRLKASKGAEKDFFIGTENGKYFGTTLWNIKVGYPGSAGDLINVFFSYVKGGTKLGYSIEFNQTTSPHNDQNKWALGLIKGIEPKVQEKIGLKKTSNRKQKIHNYKTKSRKDSYEKLDDLMVDVFQDLETLIPIVNNEISKIKEAHPAFFADQISDAEFENQQMKLKERLELDYPAKEISIKNDKKNIDAENKAFESSVSKNSILYGPPGTGKTYCTIEKAIKIINPKFDFSQPRDVIKEEYNRLVKNGQIVFTTFHQSMSYEDFIEGIKPQEPEKDGDPVIYKIELGIFRKLCIEAAFDGIQVGDSKEAGEVLDFSVLYDNFSETIQEKILQGKPVEFESKSGGKLIVESISPQGNFIVKHPEGSRTYTVSKARLSKLNSAIKSLNDVNNINDYFREIIGGSNSSAYWSVLNAIRKEGKVNSQKSNTRNFTFEEKLEVVKNQTNFKNSIGKPFVIIIDEINRGNVSQIFGELITLIEEDKRLGSPEELKVKLPYSKDLFGVPANLYIIGTMNTADRSVEALDAALRRRFTFEEMAPKPELLSPYEVLSRFWAANVGRYGPSKSTYDNYEKDLRNLLGLEIQNETKYREYGERKLIEEATFHPTEMEKVLDKVVKFNGIDLSMLLDIINKRIEKLLDKDHQIGHSYLINVYSLDQLKSAFQNKIIPLLQEYFFGDYGKIGLILGQKFFENEIELEVKFKEFFDYSDDGFSERRIYRLKNLAKMDNEEFKDAIIELMK